MHIKSYIYVNMCAYIMHIIHACVMYAAHDDINQI